jgi:hypothetical protein
MCDAADRVNRVSASDIRQAFAAIGETVWWVTIVNDTLRRNYQASYDLARRSQDPPVDATIDGLRSVRHRIGHEVDLVDFIEPVASRSAPDGRITAWVWKAVRPPTRKERRDLEGYRAYENAIAGRNIVEVFTRTIGFLRQADANAQNGIPVAR